MVDITKLDMTKIWAESGDKVQPSDEQMATGWLVQQIPRQTWNWFENRQDQNIAYLLQKGIPEWDSTTEYRATKSYVQRNGAVYKCVTTNTGTDPVSTPANWVKAFAESSASLEVLRALVPAADGLPYFTGASSAALTTLTAFARTLLDDVDATTARTTLNAQQAHVNLTTLSSVAAGANTLAYFTGTNTAATTTLTSFGRSLIDDADSAAGRATLGLGDVATRNIGTTAGTVAAGDDIRITSALKSTNNLSDIVSAAAARTNLGLGTAAVANVTTSSVDGTTGRVLQTGDFGLGGASVPLGEAAINSDRPTGFYQVSASGAGLLPLNTDSYIQHTNNSAAGFALQECRPLNSTRKFTRQQVSGVWTSWAEDWSTGNTSSNVQSLLGAANYATFRSLLGVGNKAEAGANSDITSLSGLTTPLSAAQGGTGVTANTGSGSNVLSNSPTFSGTPLAPTAAFGSNSTQIATTAFVQANAQATPTGGYLFFAGPVDNAPGGFLLANGAAISRTTYANLFTAIGTTYGGGDGTTTFNLPDARGLFLRGLDNGRGLDPSRTLGSYQGSQNLSHTHTGSANVGGFHAHGAYTDAQGQHQHSFGSGTSDGGGSAVDTATSVSGTVYTDAAGSHAHNVGIYGDGNHTHTLSIGGSGGSEARPQNISVNIYIKF